MQKEKKFTLAPASKKQEMFLNSDATVTLCGGAAGSGKSYTLLLIALKFMQHPQATGVIFRRTSKMLTAPGSIWHEAVNMYSSIFKKGLRIRYKETEIIFPNGALLKFSHMQHEKDMYNHKGAQYSFVGFDEATDFSEEMVTYLMSRMRNAHVDYRPQMFLLTNPEYNSFLRHWIQDFYLDPSTGIPFEHLAGTKRFFFRQGNKMIWYASLDEAEAVHGVGDESGITSFTFIPANCRDNPPLLKAQPDYISRLMSLPRVEMEKLLLGSWFARVEASQIWKREWITFTEHPNVRTRKRVRAWDLAFTRPSEANPNPDWTAGVLMSKSSDSIYTIENVKRDRNRVHEIESLIFKTAIEDGTDTIISIPKDPNASAGAYARDLQRRLAEMGFMVRLSPPVKSKVTRFAPFASVTQAGYVHVVTADWNKDLFEELEMFDGEGKFKDDQADAISDCFSVLNKGVHIPDLLLPDLSGSLSPVSFPNQFNQTQTNSMPSLPFFNL